MTRVLLISALVVSLWPAGAIAAIFINGAGKRDTADTTSSSDTQTPPDVAPSGTGTDSIDAAPPTSEADYDSLNRIDKRLSIVLDEARNSSGTHGVPDPALARKAKTVAHREARWLRENQSQAEPAAAEVARTGERLAGAVSHFARDPSPARLDSVNSGIRKYNAAIRASR